MTDRNAILEALTDAIRDACNGTPEAATEAEVTEAIAAAVLELCGPEPLVWKTLSDGKGRYRLDSAISAARHANGLYFVSLPCNSGSDYYWSGPAHSVGKYYPTLEAAQAAAQSHADAAHWNNTPLGKLVGVA